MNVVVTVINDIATDRRVIKQAQVLAGLGCKVTILGRKKKVSPSVEEKFFRVYRCRIPFASGPLMYISFNAWLFVSLLFRKADFIVANDLDTLLPCYLVSVLRGKPLVYDAHEYFTGQHGLTEKKLRYRIWKSIERTILPRLRWMITVSEGVASLYHKEYGVAPVVVRNVSPSSADIPSIARSELGVGDASLLVVLQGTGINPGRGAAELIEAMKGTEGVKLLIIGSGDEMERIRSAVKQNSLADKVIFLPRMPWKKMMSYTRACDAGLTLDPDTCLNQRYSLPNKLFDYISAGIPVIASRLPEVSRVIEKYGCGILLDELTPESLSTALNRLGNDRKLLVHLRERVTGASDDLSWENEKHIEQELFAGVISEISARKQDDGKN